MEMTTLTIKLPVDVSAVLEEKARTSGQDVAEYVETMIAAQLRRPTLRELFADVRADITIDDQVLETEIDCARGRR
jgi:hypothetical protein